MTHDQANTTVSDERLAELIELNVDETSQAYAWGSEVLSMARELSTRRATADVTETLENNDDQDTTLETEELDQIASTDSATTGLDVHGEIDAEGLKAATNKIRSACYRFSSLQPDMEAWLESSAYSVVRAYLAALNPPMGR